MSHSVTLELGTKDVWTVKQVVGLIEAEEKRLLSGPLCGPSLNAERGILNHLVQTAKSFSDFRVLLEDSLAEFSSEDAG